MTTSPTRILTLGLLYLSFWTTVGFANEATRFLEKQKLPNGQTVVVAEGDFEPRSMGSFSVRLYAKNEEFPTDQFLHGVISARDGAIEAVKLEDIDGDSTPEVIVIIRSAGTGGFQSGAAFSARDGKVIMVASVAELTKTADIIAGLREAAKTFKVK